MRNSSGQAALESLLATSVLVALLSVALLVAYLCFARIWIHYQLEQTVICIATQETPRPCIERLESRMKRTLHFGDWRAHGWASQNIFYVKATFHMAGKVKWQWQRQLQIEKIGKRAQRL